MTNKNKKFLEITWPNSETIIHPDFVGQINEGGFSGGRLTMNKADWCYYVMSACVSACMC